LPLASLHDISSLFNGIGFGTMPSCVGDTFGPRPMPVVYGIILTAWGVGGIYPDTGGKPQQEQMHSHILCAGSDFFCKTKVPAVVQ
jgi:hypothetical protein